MLTALHLMQVLLALSIALQTVELLRVRRSAADDGVWRLGDLERDWAFLPRPVRSLLRSLLAYRVFVILLGLRLVSAVLSAVWLNPVLYAFLLVSTVLIAIRWRGSFNGGSDFMTLVATSALCVASAFPSSQRVTQGCLLYVGVIACNSYFIAGLAKVRRASWRNGSALRGFVRQSLYQPPVLQRPALALVASVGVLVLECGFPLVLLQPQLCLGVLAVMFSFHLANAWVFGLNRFVLAWLAAYPALYECSVRFAESHPLAGLQ